MRKKSATEHENIFKLHSKTSTRYNNNYQAVRELVLLVHQFLTTIVADKVVSSKKMPKCKPFAALALILASDIQVKARNITNSYHTGCLKQKLPGWTKLRVCNSEDTPESIALNRCRLPDPSLNYLEVRLKAQDWESVVFTCWILQIILSELVDVPTTIENGVPASYLMNFYHPDNIFELGDSTDSLSVFENAASVGGDCRKMPHLSSPDVNEENYKIYVRILYLRFGKPKHLTFKTWCESILYLHQRHWEPWELRAGIFPGLQLLVILV